MTLAEVRRAFRARLRKPALWGVFALVSGAYAVYPLLQWLRQTPRPSLTLLAIEFPAALLFYFAFIWLSPVAWQWDGKSGPAPSPGPRILQALLVAEALVTAMVLLDDRLGRWAGRGPLPLDIYIANLCFQGPALFLVGNLMATREHLEEERQALRQKSEEAQGLHLKGQIHPHVLFNALNGLAELLEDDRREAEACVQAMSDFLHRILVASEQATWPLREERILVEQFLVMESLRLGDRLAVRWDWEPGAEALPVLPMLLQPLVENALKHGINPSEEGGELVIASRLEGQSLLLEVRNTGNSPGRPGHGVGLQNLRTRLGLAYRRGAAFELTREDPWTAARIRLNLFSINEAHEQLADPGGG